MDPNTREQSTWKLLRNKFRGPHRKLAIPAVIAAMLFYRKKGPATGSDARKVGDDGKRADEDVAA